MIFMAGGNAYSLAHEYKSGWNPEAFRERYSEVLERFDYIVGDWGYNQLRLRGFYRDGHPRATKESAISSFVDYINEYCNFGCAHFVLHKLDVNALPPDAEISREESPEAIVALSETGGQAAETAAAAAAPSGPIMRWPLKERAGGPVRVPNITVSAVARAAADAERRLSGANGSRDPSQSGGYAGSRSGGYKSAQEGKQGRGPSGAGGDRRPSPSGQGGMQGAGRQQHYKHPRQQGGAEAQSNRSPDNRGGGQRYPDQRPSHVPGGTPRANGVNGAGIAERSQPQAAMPPQARQDGTRGDSRWQSGKNRRRKSFGPKPNARPEAGPRTENGAPRQGE
ncbi:YutD-like domain-containing protein [Cohnella soli]|uniref:YutD-like domain-containing protein n=1 Tax=Cohnella soli TaxID=425005 RepID=A0ABW0HS72_9BACL